MRNLVIAVVAVLVVAVASTIVFSHRGDIYRHLYRRQLAAGPELVDTASPPAPIAIVNVNVIPMTFDGVLPNHTVLIEAGRISAIGPARNVPVGERFQRIDGRGRYLMPGLADMHVHLNENALALQLFLVNGVTTIREMNGSAKILNWADKANSGLISSPRIHTTGPIFDGRAHEDSGEGITSADAARQRVREQQMAGFRSLKPYTWLDDDVYQALMREARLQDMYVVGHIPYSVGLEGAIAAGQHEIAHIHSFHADFFRGFDPQDVFAEYEIDRERVPETVARVRQAGMTVTSTLVVNQALADAKDSNAYFARPMMEFEFSWGRRLMNSPAWYFDKLWSREYLEDTYLPWIYELLDALHEARVRIVLGTDSGVTGLVHGFSTHEELKLLVRSGLTPFEALQTATVNAAAVVGEESEWGSIEISKAADLILLEADPRMDVANVDRIVSVIRNGLLYDSQELGEMKQRIRSAVQ